MALELLCSKDFKMKPSITDEHKSHQRPSALIAIVIYKAFSALLLAATSIALLLTLKNYQDLDKFSESYALVGNLDIIKWILEKVAQLNPKTLAFSGIAAGIYSVVTVVETVGLWYQKFWARVLVLVLVSLSIPPEIYEIARDISLVKLMIFLINLAVFSYLLRHSLVSEVRN